MPADIREGFREATRFFVELADRIPAEKWDEPGLGIWSVRELVAHAAHTFESITGYSSPSRTADRIEIESTPKFWVRLLDKAQDPAREERARLGGSQLGDDAPAVIRGWSEEALAILDSVPDDHPTRSIGGGVRFIDWLATRVVELTVHTLDLADAVRIDAEPPEAALATTLGVLSDLAVATGKASELVMAATGRSGLAAGYSLMA